ncbi:MAG TPA: DoxX family protein [Ohtaekwangia sp.]
MKKTNILFWIFTVLFGGFMISTSIPNIIVDEGSVNLITTQLGYPKYMIPFLGVAKLLGSLVILIPGFPRLKEWAYAGLFFDLVGATYSAICVEGWHLPMLFMVLPFGIGALSYIYHHKRLKSA